MARGNLLQRQVHLGALLPVGMLEAVTEGTSRRGVARRGDVSLAGRLVAPCNAHVVLRRADFVGAAAGLAGRHLRRRLRHAGARGRGAAAGAEDAHA